MQSDQGIGLERCVMREGKKKRKEEEGDGKIYRKSVDGSMRSRCRG